MGFSTNIPLAMPGVEATIFVKPASDALIVLEPDPPHYRLPADGKGVPVSAYWLRALRRGDVVVLPN